MPTIHVEAHLSRRDLLKATEQLDPAEFQQFVADVLGLRAQRQAPRLSANESDLLLTINRGLPEDVQRQERWQIAVENLINAAETGGGWLMFARIGVMRALNGDARER